MYLYPYAVGGGVGELQHLAISTATEFDKLVKFDGVKGQNELM